MSIENVISTSPKMIKTIFNNVPIPFLVRQKRQNDLYLIDYNGTIYKESKYVFKKSLGINATKFHKNNPDLLDDLKRSVNERKSTTKKIKSTCNSSKDGKFLLSKIDSLLSDIVSDYTIDITEQKFLE